MAASMGIKVEKTKAKIEREEAARQERVSEAYALVLASAVACGEAEPLDWILSGDWVERARPIHFKSALVACGQGDRVRAMKRVLSTKRVWTEAFVDGEVLSEAVSFSAMECIEALVEAGASAAVEGGCDSDMLVAAMYREEDSHRHALVKRLIELGAPVDGYAKSTPPLCVAAMRRDKKSIELLLEAGADIEIRNEKGATALILAIEESGDDMGLEASAGVVDALLKAGASVDALDWYKESALHNACASGVGEAVKLLIEAGAKPWIKNRNGETPLDVGIESIQEDACMALAHAVDAGSRTAAQWFKYADDAEDNMPGVASLLRSKGEARTIGVVAKGKKSTSKKGAALRI